MKPRSIKIGILCLSALFAILQLVSFFLPFAVFDGMLEDGTQILEVVPMCGDNFFYVFSSLAITITLTSVSFNPMLIRILNSILLGLLLIILFGIAMSWAYSKYPFHADRGSGLTLYAFSTGGLAILSLALSGLSGKVAAGRWKKWISIVAIVFPCMTFSAMIAKAMYDDKMESEKEALRQRSELHKIIKHRSQHSTKQNSAL